MTLWWRRLVCNKVQWRQDINQLLQRRFDLIFKYFRRYEYHTLENSLYISRLIKLLRTDGILCMRTHTISFVFRSVIIKGNNITTPCRAHSENSTDKISIVATTMADVIKRAYRRKQWQRFVISSLAAAQNYELWIIN